MNHQDGVCIGFSDFSIKVAKPFDVHRLGIGGANILKVLVNALDGHP
jgi:hypothetical protein